MSKGYVYVLTNEHMPGLVKIGMTTRSVEQRAEELYQTGVPGKFEIYWSGLFQDCAQAEATLHHQYSSCRVRGNREFFRVEPRDVAQFANQLQIAHVLDVVEEFIPDCSIVHVSAAADLAKLDTRARNLGMEIPDFYEAISSFTDDEIMEKARAAS